MDIGTLIGLVLGFSLIVGAIVLGGSIGGFVDLPSVIIVFGGTIATTFIMYAMPVALGAVKVAMKALFTKTREAPKLIELMVRLAEKARKESLVALEKVQIEDPFVKKGIQLVADGTSQDLVRVVLDTEVAGMRRRHIQGQGMFKAMGTMAPAFGMIGTLIGLVKMLQNLSDPGSIGPAMAVALLTTFYGAVLANVVFLPVAKKLEERSDEEAYYMEIATEGIMSIMNGDHPTIVREKLLAYLPPGSRPVPGRKG